MPGLDPQLENLLPDSSPPAAKEQPATVTCAQCGCTSPLSMYFRKQWGKHYCPRCMGERGSRGLVMEILFLFALGLFISLLRSQGTGGFDFSGLIEMVMVVMVIFVIVIGHELIHGLAAWLLGGRVFELALGVGEVRRSVWWRGVRFSLRRQLFMGIAVCVFPRRSGLHLRRALYLMAPLAVQIALVLFLWNRPGLWADVAGYDVRNMLIIANGWLIVVNLFPWKFNEILATDGYRLLELVRGRKTVDELHEQFFLVDGVYAQEREDYAAMAAAAAAGLALYPNAGQLKNLQAAALFSEERFDEALVLFDQFLAEGGDDTPLPVRALWLSNQAGATFFEHLLGGDITPARLDVAHAAVAEAYSLIPWVTPVEVVVALSALARGHIQDALDGFQRAVPYQHKVNDRAELLLLVALAHHHLGQGDAARSALTQAQALSTRDSRLRAWVVGVVG